MTKRTKPPRLDGESEDDYYMRLIQDLANEKLALFARYQMESQQQQEECKELVTNLLSLKKSKKNSLKRGQRDFKEVDIDIEIKNKKKKKKKKKKKVGSTTNKVDRRPVVVNKVTEGLKQFIIKKHEINNNYSSEIKLVIQKTLTASDLNPGQNRLNMPANQLETNANDFLTADEIRTLKEKDKTKSGVKVGMLGPNLRMYDKMLELKIWNMACTKNYVLISNWRNFVKQHHKLLKVGTLIQFWTFRVNKQLCLALVCPDHDDDVTFVEKGHDENDDKNYEEYDRCCC